jgi:hypothetical protein
MFKRFNEKKADKNFVLDIFLDHELYNKFMNYTKKNNLDESKALIKVLRRGIDNYWLLEYKQLKEDYAYIEQSYCEHMQDNKVLIRLEKENEKLKALLANNQNNGEIS